MKKHLPLLFLALILFPVASFAQLVAEGEEDMYDRDYELCSQQAEEKADPLPEDKREETFIQHFHECMKKKGHTMEESDSASQLPEGEESEEIGSGIEE